MPESGSDQVWQERSLCSGELNLPSGPIEGHGLPRPVIPAVRGFFCLLFTYQ